MRNPDPFRLMLLTLVYICVACSGTSQEANEKNMQKGLNAYLQQQGITIDLCRQFPIRIEIERLSATQRDDNIHAGPFELATVTRKPLKKVSKQKRRFDALEQAGLLCGKEIEAERMEKLYWSKPARKIKIKAKEYTITAKGQKFLKAPDTYHSDYRLQIATAKAEILKIGSPTPFQGYTVSKINYNCQPEVCDWVSPEIKACFPEIEEKLKPGTNNATMVLMDTGWVHSHTIKQ